MKINQNKFLKNRLSRWVTLASIGALTGVGLPAMAADEEVEADEIVVTGQRASIQSAQDLKKNSNVVVDSIVSDDIGKLPDRSVTEALQRVPGVTVGRYTNNDAEHPAGARADQPRAAARRGTLPRRVRLLVSAGRRPGPARARPRIQRPRAARGRRDLRVGPARPAEPCLRHGPL